MSDGMEAFAGNLEQFKHATKDFLDVVQDPDETDTEALEQAKKYYALKYLELKGSTADIAIAKTYFDYAMRRYITKVISIDTDIALVTTASVLLPRGKM